MHNNSRYERQFILPEIGFEGQSKLQRASVLIIGMGGLGCPVVQYLSAAGVGKIGMVDYDHVSIENLNRQFLFGEKNIGQLKVEIAAEKITDLYTDVEICSYPFLLNNSNAISIIQPYDMVLDCTDNFPTRYLLSDVCRMLKKILIVGAVSQYEGQVVVFDHIKPISYRNLFPVPPQIGEIKNCAEAGVLGSLPGFIGTIMATETIKLIAGFGETLINKLLTVNLLNYQQFILTIDNEEVTVDFPKTEEALLHFDYGIVCGNSIINISWNEFEELRTNKNIELIDIREKEELSIFTKNTNVKNIPFSKIMEGAAHFELPEYALICQSGKRSKLAAEYLSYQYKNTKTFYQILHGVNGINEEQS